MECQGTPKRRVKIEWMPVWLRASHEAAGNHGSYPHNGAERLLVDPACAKELIASDPEWVSLVT